MKTVVATMAGIDRKPNMYTGCVGNMSEKIANTPKMPPEAPSADKDWSCSRKVLARQCPIGPTRPATR